MSLKPSQRLLLWGAPAPTALLLRGLAKSWRVREHEAQGLRPGDCGRHRFIYAFWHEYILPMVGHYRDQDIHGLASRSFDGELIAALLLKLGFPRPARGSSSRGGAGALLELLSFLKAGDHVVVTVDGPRGPRRQVQDGAVKLSQLSGLPLVPVGVASSSPLRLKSWDKTLIPIPLSRVHFQFGKPFHVPAGKAALLKGRQRLQRELEQVTRLAEEEL